MSEQDKKARELADQIRYNGRDPVSALTEMAQWKAEQCYVATAGAGISRSLFLDAGWKEKR